MTESNTLAWQFQTYLNEFSSTITQVVSKTFTTKNSNKLLYGNDNAKKIVNFHNTLLLVSNKNKIEKKILCNKPYDELQIKLCQKVIKPGFVCLDVEANIGTYSLLFSSLVGTSGKVIAFEPVDYIRENLLINLRVNGIKNTTVQSIEKGLSGFNKCCASLADYCTTVDVYK